MFRSVSLLFESLSTLYDEQLVTFVTLTQQLVSLVASITGLSVLFFSMYVVVGLIKHVHAIKYKYVCCCLALSTPQETAKLLYKHFKDAERRLKDAEGETYFHQLPLTSISWYVSETNSPKVVTLEQTRR